MTAKRYLGALVRLAYIWRNCSGFTADCQPFILMDAMIIRLEIQCELASVPNYSKGIRCVTSFASVEQKTILLSTGSSTLNIVFFYFPGKA